MDLSIIIVSWRVKELLKDCLKSIFEETQNINFEVFVVDNNSGDGTIEMLMEYFPQVTIISSSRNLGFSGGCNMGLKQASGRYLLLLNPDTKIIDNALDKIVAHMDKHKEFGLAGCKLLNYDGSIQESVRTLPTFKIHLAMIFRFQHFILNDY
ncbi:glycosyltransferase family 2 protein, partial [bacterium]|nr:glycosyltransferase family 2 protein [bacterium]MBT4335519.1 glycosyltransferase family 2 protein [bacterium]